GGDAQRDARLGGLVHEVLQLGRELRVEDAWRAVAPRLAQHRREELLGGRARQARLVAVQLQRRAHERLHVRERRRRARALLLAERRLVGAAAVAAAARRAAAPREPAAPHAVCVCVCWCAFNRRLPGGRALTRLATFAWRRGARASPTCALLLGECARARARARRWLPRVCTCGAPRRRRRRLTRRSRSRCST